MISFFIHFYLICFINSNIHFLIQQNAAMLKRLYIRVNEEHKCMSGCFIHAFSLHYDPCVTAYITVYATSFLLEFIIDFSLVWIVFSLVTISNWKAAILNYSPSIPLSSLWNVCNVHLDQNLLKNALDNDYIETAGNYNRFIWPIWVRFVVSFINFRWNSLFQVFHNCRLNYFIIYYCESLDFLEDSNTIRCTYLSWTISFVLHIKLNKKFLRISTY